MTPKEQQCLSAIRRLTVDGVPPSYDELATELGIGSKSGVFRPIKSLERQGKVRRGPHRYRSLIILEGPRQAAEAVNEMLCAALAHGRTPTVQELEHTIAGALG